MSILLQIVIMIVFVFLFSFFIVAYVKKSEPRRLEKLSDKWINKYLDLETREEKIRHIKYTTPKMFYAVIYRSFVRNGFEVKHSLNSYSNKDYVCINDDVFNVVAYKGIRPLELSDIDDQIKKIKSSRAKKIIVFYLEGISSEVLKNIQMNSKVELIHGIGGFEMMLQGKKWEAK